MTAEHPNITLLKRLDPSNLAGAADIFSEDVILHFFNPLLPDIQGDYVGLPGVQAFFEGLAEQTRGTFKVNPVSLNAIGDELVVAHTRNTMSLDDRLVETDVVVVWRIVDDKIKEVWDIPSVYSAPPSQT